MREVIRKLTLKSCAARGPKGDKGDSDAVTIVYVTDTDATIEPEDNHIYKCGELASLTVVNAPTSGCYDITFSSGITLEDPTEISGLSDVIGGYFEPAGNMYYEINVMDNIAAIGQWAGPIGPICV